MQQLGTSMTAQEFGQHYALELEEPLPHAQWNAMASLLAAVANGPLVPRDKGRFWAACDFMPTLWADIDDAAATEPDAEPLTVEQIMARARMAGMVH